MNENFVEPMLASKPKNGQGVSDFHRDEWLLEEKFDGHRMIIRHAPEGVTAWSRVGNERTLHERLVKAIKATWPFCTIDGELYLPGGTSTDVTCLDTLHQLKIVAFDILKIQVQDGPRPEESVMSLPGHDRRRVLEMAMSKIDGDLITLASQHDPSEETLHMMWNRGGEGAILKRRDTRYEEAKRSRNWIKLKKEGMEVIRVDGFEAGLTGKYSAITGIAESDGKSRATVKTLNREWYRRIEKEPDAFKGRRLLISYQNRTTDGSFRHSMADRWLTEGEMP